MKKKPYFEIGCIYKKEGKRTLFLATTHYELIYTESGVVKKTTPYTQYKYRNDITFDDLCENWGVTEERLDEISKEYMPTPGVTRTRPKGNRKRRAAEEHDWRELCLARISLSA